MSNGPSQQGTIASQFNCEGTTLSGLELELVGSGYRLSLVKRRFVSGKYCHSDISMKYFWLQITIIGDLYPFCHFQESTFAMVILILGQGMLPHQGVKVQVLCSTFFYHGLILWY